jgi:hypothetical protein
MSAQPIDCRVMLRPIFKTSAQDIANPIAFANANWDALVAWYVELANEARGTAEEMPDFVSFVAIQLDIERCMRGLPIYRVADPVAPVELKDRKYADEGYERYGRNDERAANDAGSRTRGPI